MSLLRFFRDEAPAQEEDGIDDARRTIDFSQHPEFAELMVWLERQRDQKVHGSDYASLAAGLARSEALKEVRDYLRRRTDRAQAILSREREER